MTGAPLFHLPALLVALALAAGSALAAPPPAKLPTRNQRRVEGSSGAYLGYRDGMRADGLFVIKTGDVAVEVHARYRWRWSSTEGKQEQGAEDRRVHVDPDSRAYIDRVDLDEYDAVPVERLATWLWVPVDLTVGDAVPILDQIGRVEAEERVEVAGQSWDAWRIVAQGEGDRIDAYGQMHFVWREVWWYERETGLFLRSAYDEEANGLIDGQAGAYRTEERVERVVEADASLLSDFSVGRTTEETHSSTGIGGLLVCFSPLFPFFAMTGYFFWASWVRRPGRKIWVPGLGRVELREVGEVGELFALRLEGEGTLRSILPDLARRSLSAGGRVLVARQGAKILGLSIGEPADLCPPGQAQGTVIAGHPVVIRALVYKLGLMSWFATTRSGVRFPERFVEVEEWVVLEREALSAQPWDPGLIRPMKRSDAPAVAALLAAEGDPGAARWLEVQLQHGDQGLVAVLDGRIVGAALFGLHGAVGRLHGLVVDREHRGRGIGAELVRARLDALHLLGAERVMVEIAARNLASLHLAREAGFQPTGVLYVEARGKVPPPGAVERR